MSEVKSKRIEVFRPGSFVAMGGERVTFSADDLKSLAAAYDPVNAPTPAVIGHPEIDDPAYAWATAFSFDEAKQRLFADLGDLEPQFADAVAAGRYKKISLALFGPEHPANPKPGAFYPKHIGFLGAAAPAVSGLKPVAFQAVEGAMVFEFGEPALKDVASLFQLMREFLIEKFGSEQADKTMPSWSIRWIDEAANREDEPAIRSLPAFSEPKEPIMADPKPADTAALEQRLAELQKREAARNAADNLAFADSLVKEGRLLPLNREKVATLLTSLQDASAGPLVVSFADGGAEQKVEAAKMLRDILAAQPQIVSFGALDVGADPVELSFANADDVAQRAAAFQAEQAAKGIIIEIGAAVDHVTKGAAK